MEAASEIGAKEKLQVLLAEYSALRTESIHRNSNIFQLIAVVVVLLGFSLSRTEWDIQFWLTSTLAIATGAILGYRIHRDVDIAAQRMRQIEQRVNDLV